MITAQVESLTKGLAELKPLLPLHYKELAIHQEHVPLDPQYDLYLTHDLNGEVLYVTLRELGRLIGYFIGFVGPELHYKTCLGCTLDIFYVVKEHRGKLGGRVLFGEVLRELKYRKVMRLHVGYKIGSEVAEAADALFTHMGFTPSDKYFVAWLGD